MKLGSFAGSCRAFISGNCFSGGAPAFFKTVYMFGAYLWHSCFAPISSWNVVLNLQGCIPGADVVPVSQMRGRECSRDQWG